MSSLKISIITVSLNAVGNMKQVIDSVANQIDVKLEHIICDGFSLDGTQEIIEKQLEQYIHINFISEKDNGIYEAINKGIKKSSGDIIGILNADDFYVDNTILNKVINQLNFT